MGNAPSNARHPHTQPPSGAASPLASPPHHEPIKPPSTRRGIQQRSAAAPEPSLAQARGTTTLPTTATHRPWVSQTHPIAQLSQQAQTPSTSSPSSQSNSSDSQMGAQQSREEPKVEHVEVRDQPSQPVDVPALGTNPDTASAPYAESIEPSGPPTTQDMSYHLTRPPRLPLPIEEEVHTPGSPIIAPSDLDAPVLDIESLDHDALPRRASALSNTTIDEEDAEELRVDKTKATVPTKLEWLEGKGGEKVYVTGTIFQWNKKHRLHPVEGQPGVYRSSVHVRPGTHHIRFIVDGIMQYSKHLPTTVDFGNNLVNYIEVSADDIPKPNTASEEAKPAGGESKTPDPSKKGEVKTGEDEKSETAKPAKAKPVLPQGRFSSQVPQYLVDLDKAEDSAEYHYAAAAIEKLPSAPSLPGFLGKPILNAATPMKDDNSVLTMPNHTVLNHLVTSRIKENVLAVSATTRYKRKYVTTIMYKPKAADD